MDQIRDVEPAVKSNGSDWFIYNKTNANMYFPNSKMDKTFKLI